MSLNGERPDGRRLMRAGKLALITGVVAALLGAFDYLAPSVLNFSPIADLLSIVALAGIFLGTFAWLVGYVVLAMSYIGRNDT